MMNKTLLTGFHITAFALFSFAVYYDFMYTIVPAKISRLHNTYGGKFKFLTYWDAIAQALFFLICTLNDFYGTNSTLPKTRPIFRKIKDYFHATFSFPLAMFVGVTFWALMFVDRELVLPKAIDPYFPSWLNHLMHTVIMVTTIIEMMVAPRQYPKRSRGFSGLVGLMLVYLVWMHFIYYKSGVWVYPVMEVLSLPLRIAFFIVLFALASILYIAGEKFDQILWGSANKSIKGNNKKKSK